MKKVVLTTAISPDVLARLDRAVAALGISRSLAVQKILAGWLDLHETEIAPFPPAADVAQEQAHV